MSWTVRHGQGRLLVITNETGAEAADVEMKLRGKAVGGMVSSRNWSFSRPSMAHGQSVEAPFRAALGAKADPPRMEITWTDPGGQQRETVVSLPL
jgi:hypothetical protein